MALKVSIGKSGNSTSQSAHTVARADAEYTIADARDVAAKPAGRKVLAANGVNSTSVDLSIPANALIDEYLLRIKAARSTFAKATDAGEVRQRNNSPLEIVVDFGKMITVSGIRIPYKVSSFSAYGWLGSRFDLDNDVSKNFIGPRVEFVQTSENLVSYLFEQEIRTERLLLIFSDKVSSSVINSELELSLPDLPSNLSIRINGGPPVWEYAGLVQAGSASSPNEDDWDKNAELLVSLATPLQELCGDATRNEQLAINIELNSQTPGNLAISLHQRSLRLLHRRSFDSDSELRIEYGMEGKAVVALESPGAVGKQPNVLGVQLKLAADFPAERALPALGENANGISELVLGNGKAACVRLDGIDDLAQIAAVRLPLSSRSSRAEARVVLWQGDAGAPTEVIEDAVSDPLSWTGSDAALEQWQLFNFAEAIDNGEDDVFWLALIIERGEVCWRLASSSDGNEYPVRLGAPAGPWRALPAIFSKTSSLGLVAGRLHIIGLAQETKPIAALTLGLSGATATTEVKPNKDGVGVQLSLDTAAKKSAAKKPLTKTELSITSRASGTLTLSEVDIITEDTQAS